MALRLIIIYFLSITLIPSMYAEYVIEGKVNMEGNWAHQIFLATVDKLDDYYNADASFTINQAPIDENGYFQIIGDNLPNQAQFYRLYLIKESASEFDVCLFVGGDNHNYIHLILDNDSKVDIQADQETFAPFGNYQINADQDNILMKRLSELIYPAHHFFEIKFPSELKFSRDKLNRDLFNFADSCSSPLVALAAINNTDFENYIDAHADEYHQVLVKMQDHFPKHEYTQNFYRKFKFYTHDWEADTSTSKILNVILSMLCLGLLWRVIKLESQKPKAIASGIPNNQNTALTNQERRILTLIADGKLNKEIASELFVGLSTIKSHINKIYSKLGVKNRTEAIQKFKSLNL